ncbi:peptidase M23B [Novosphingobium sp. Rr 2-17]|uniref:M23 family metallopeptidase n=1 Tax=Novosphingobium sp. Rr 2-17 TaxID=555793 RepID=UPI0002697BB7|nr:M23 family metallopeptidase [Novosphingobium sp. Rr 2-17]EIZ77640.1 peptidase M23B [Novosphingobium sp. Rr 2-17]
MIVTNAGALLQRFRAAFPDREFIMRSQGQVRFIRISSRTQKIALAGTIGLLSAGTAALGSLTVARYSAESQVAALDHRAAAVAKAETKVAKYREDVHELTDDLARRQRFIEQMVQAHIGDLPEAGSETGEAKVQPAADTAPKTGETLKVSAALPEVGALRQLEAEQLAFADRLTRYADSRAASTSAAIRKLGLNPGTLVAASRSNGKSRMAMGGPLVQLATGRDGSVDPRFRHMGESLARASALEDSLAALPRVSPAHVAYVSSSYGYRADPFTGGAAFHAGLDFPGPMGSPIYAAAQGTVTFVGQRQGYGNCIEVTHASGLMTRYGHLSRFRTHVGQKVAAGTVIGAMGSTGRSTGSHLHFEVRINDQPVNPRPFLEAAAKAQQEHS